jgi:hypothetical protein
VNEFVKTVNAFMKASAQKNPGAIETYRAKIVALKSKMDSQELTKAERIEAILGAYHQ